MPRIFIAALIPEEIKKRIYSLIKDSEPDFQGVKWEKAHKLHITLNFIGDVDCNTCNKVVEKVSSSVNNTGPIDLTYSHFDAFPDFKRPRVIVLRFCNSNELLSLKRNIDSELSDIGIRMENRPFIPHITIGRVKKGFRARDKAVKADLPDFRIESIAVVKSKLQKWGSEYINLGVYKLL